MKHSCGKVRGWETEGNRKRGRWTLGDEGNDGMATKSEDNRKIQKAKEPGCGFNEQLKNKPGKKCR